MTAAGIQNSKRLMILILFLAVALCSTRLLGQEPLGHFDVRPFTSKEGIPAGLVMDIAQDHEGRMWFATRSGISSYDSQKWMNYKSIEGLPGAMYIKLDVDKAGNLWALGNLWPLSVSSFDGKKWTLHRFEEKLTAKQVFGFFMEVPTWEGHPAPVVAIPNHHLRILDQGLWRQITFSSPEPPEITGMAEFRDSVLVVANGQVYQIDNPTEPKLFKELDLDVEGLINLSVEETPHGPVFWLYAKDWIGKYENDRFNLIREIQPMAMPILYNRTVVQHDGLGGMFFGSYFKLNHLDLKERLTPFNMSRGLIAEGATAVFKDRENAFWISGGRGLSKISSLRFENFNTSDGLLENEVASIAEMSPGVYIFGHNNGLTIYKDGVFEKRPFPRENDILQRSVDIRLDGEGNAWISILSRGVARLDKDLNLKFFNSPINQNNTFSVLPDSKGVVWVVCNTGIYQLVHGQYRKVPEIDTINGRRMFEDDEGILYLVTNTEGIWYNDGHWKNITSRIPRENNIYSFLKDSKGRRWAGSFTGLMVLEDDVLKQASPFGFHLDRPIYFMSEDPHGRIWMGTDQGIYRLDEDQWRYFSTSHGLSDMETNRGAALADSKGTFWIGTAQGASRYNERFDEITPPAKPGPIYLKVEEERVLLQNNLKLPYHQNNLEFAFNAVTFVHENAVVYKTFLEGADKDWSTSNQTKLTYRNLRPGNYKFHYKAKNALGQWSETITSPTIKIKKPFWEKWQFIILILITIAGLGFSIIDYLSSKRYSRYLSSEVSAQTKEISMKNMLLEQKVKERQEAEARVQALNEELETRVKERTAELEAAQKDLVENAHYTGMAEIATSILHNVGNILNSISTSGYMIRETVESSKMAAILKANALLEKNMDRIEDFLCKDPKGMQLLKFYLSLGEMYKTENQKLSSHINSLIEKIDTVKEVVSQQHNYASGTRQSEERVLQELLETSVKILESSMTGRDIEIERDYEEVPKVVVQKTKLVHTLVNILKNAREAIQAHNSPVRKIWLSISQESGWVEARVKDSGEGISKDNLEKVFKHGFTTKKEGHGFGLHSCAKAMEDIGGQLLVESEGPGCGATFILRFPIQSQEESEPPKPAVSD